MLLVGVDIIEIDRIKKAVNRNPRFCKRIYTDKERDYCAAQANPYPSLAARFAAKEAFRKLSPQLTSRIKFKDLEVDTITGGKPVLNLYGQARKNAESVGLKEIDISLSHSRQQAVAVVVARTE
ncbi:MAG: holo-ACP synthase [Syntrophothermaceae bacterium]